MPNEVPTAEQRAEWKRLATEMCHGDGPWKTILLLLAEVERLERESKEWALASPQPPLGGPCIHAKGGRVNCPACAAGKHCETCLHNDWSNHNRRQDVFNKLRRLAELAHDNPRHRYDATSDSCQACIDFREYCTPTRVLMLLPSAPAETKE